MNFAMNLMAALPFGRHNPEPRKTFHGYGAATRFRPEWRVGFLAFKAGVNGTRDNSITGGGQIYGNEYRAMGANVSVAYTPRIQSTTGGGQVASLPPEIIALMGGQVGRGS